MFGCRPKPLGHMLFAAVMLAGANGLMSGRSSGDVEDRPATLALAEDDRQEARQVTMFAILATRDSAAIDSRLSGIKGQLRKLLPNHGFKLLDARSEHIGVGQALRCDLGKGYEAETRLVRSLDENGKVQLRCIVSKGGEEQFSTLVKTPANQLFFYERTLKDGSRVLVGVGAR